MNRLASLACAGLVATAAACKGSTSGPQSLHVAEDAPDHVALEWLPPAAGDFDGYALEWRAGNGAFSPLATFAVSATSGGASLGPEVPDAVDVEFRLRATPDPDATRSAVAVLARGARPPSVGCELNPCAQRDGFHLYLRNRSPGATALVVRSWRFVGGSAGWEPRAPAELPPDAGHYVDPLADGWREEEQYLFEASALKNGRASVATESVLPARLPLVAPANVSAVAITGGTEISFEDRSPGADCYRVERIGQPYGGTGLVAECVAPPGVGGTATLVDPATVGSASPFLYRVTAVGWLTSSFPTYAWTGPAPGPGLVSRFLTLPVGDEAVRADSGAFATAGRGSAIYPWIADVWVVHAPGPLGPVPLPWDIDFYPGVATLAIGADDRIHALVTGSTSAYSDGTSTLRHAVFADGAWSLEPVPAGSYGSVAFDLGTDGVARAGWLIARSYIVEAVLATRSASGWDLETLPDDAAGPLLIGTDAVGSPHVLHGTHRSNELAYMSRSGGGWATEVISPVDLYGARLTLLASRDPATLLVADPYATSWFERTTTGWRLSQTLEGTWIGARSADGSAIVMAGPGEVRVEDAGGLRVLYRPASGTSSMATGISRSGKAWVLEILAADSQGEMAAVLYEEP